MPTIHSKILQHFVSKTTSDHALQNEAKRQTDRTRHITTALTQQEQNRRPILLRHTNSPQHILLRPHIRQPPQPRRLTQRRINMSRTQRIHANWGKHLSFLGARIRIRRRSCTPREGVLRMPPFSGKRASKLVHGGFGCVVRGCVNAAITDVPAHAGDEDDAAGDAGLVHGVRDGARDEECPCDVDVEDLAEDVGVVVACIAFAGDGSAGDKAAD